VVGVHLPVEEINAGNLHGFDDGIDLGGVAALRKIGNAFNQSVRHDMKDNERWADRANWGESTFYSGFYVEE
jgi:hypothetical protein